MVNKFYKLMNSKFMLFLIFFILLKPGSFSEYNAWKNIGNVINILRMFACVWCLFYFLLRRGKNDKLNTPTYF